MHVYVRRSSTTQKINGKDYGTSFIILHHRKESNNVDRLPRLILVILAPFFDQICEDVIKIRRLLFTSVFIVDYTAKKQLQNPVLPLPFWKPIGHLSEKNPTTMQVQAYGQDLSCQAAGRAGCSARVGEPRTERDNKAGRAVTSPTRAHSEYPNKKAEQSQWWQAGSAKSPGFRTSP